MRILYGVQGTGHGHLSRAHEILPRLQAHADVDVLISGTQRPVQLPTTSVRTFRGLTYTYDERGRVAVLRTTRDLGLRRFVRDVRALDMKPYDLVVTDFEPISAWAAKRAGLPCLAMSNQAAFLSPRVPRPAKRSWWAEAIFRHFAPSTHAVGFHFERYDSHIEPPIIRPPIRALTPTEGDHVTVYLPGYHDTRLTALFRQLPETRWEVFSPYRSEAITTYNVTVYPLGTTRFLESLATCHGVLTGSGFETCSEALFLGKKLCSVPVSNQYEQLCNAVALKQMGVTVLNSVDADHVSVLRRWLAEGTRVQLAETADLATIVPHVLEQAVLHLA